jgi:hypothetical protein
LPIQRDFHFFIAALVDSQFSHSTNRVVEAKGLPNPDVVERRTITVPIQRITPFLWFNRHAQRVMKALMTMKKLDIRALEEAREQSS